MDRRPITEQLEFWETEDYWHHAGNKGVKIPAKLSSLRQKLYQKAKQEPKFRFYALYDRIYRKDVIACAYAISRANAGAPGVDGVTFKEIESSPEGSDGFIDSLVEALKTKAYKPDAVCRVYIPKPDGGQRPLGIPTIRDRVAQMATLLILEPIFEADFLDCSYGFRPGRSAHDALKEIHKNLREGRRAVYDADLSGYFDSIPHDKLMKCLQMRITDRSVLKLIKMWLKAPIVESDGHGGTKVTRNQTGTPQGGVISPLLANLYLHWFDKVFNSTGGPVHWANARIIRYDKDLRGRSHRYLNSGPSKKAINAEQEKLRSIINKEASYIPLPKLIEKVNQHLIGWSSYFRLGYPRVAFRKINWYVGERLTCHLRRRSQRPYRPPEGLSYYRHYRRLGLIDLCDRTRC